MTSTNPVHAFLVDLDGTFYRGNQLLPGAADFLPFLEHTGRSALFLTNKSSKNRHAYVQKLAAMGQVAPIQTALVLSGETKADDLESSPFKPTYIFANLAELIAFFA